jgi:UDP-2,3-diacylglucosamine hydrolase
MSLEIKNGAIFIADAHESARRKEFLHFLQALENGEIQTRQLFLMGDIFDLLVGEVKNCVKKYHPYILLLEKLAQKIEIFYFEGNHDFCLEKIFLHVKVIPLCAQPLKCTFENGKKAYLLHGDKYGGFVHSLYTAVIRSKKFLKILDFFDRKIDYWLSNKIESGLLEKNICSKIPEFEKLILRKVKAYYPSDAEYILEGHYHQNRQFSVNQATYINFSSFACNQSYFIVECFQGVKFSQKKLRGCDV